MSKYIDESEEQRRAYRQIRKNRVRRQRILRRRRKIVSVLSMLLIIVVIVIAVKNFPSAQNRKTVKEDAKRTTEVSQDETEEAVQKKISIKYPVIADSYTEITSDTIKSPYIALLDVENNEVIAGRNTDTRIYPASMTKVMSLIVAVENLESLEDTFTFTNEMLDPLVKAQASRAGFDPGETVSVNDLLYGLILPSGADAADALAQLTAGSQKAFVELMNEKCQEIGLKNTHFMNPSGLYDDNQYTTPIEMAMIMEYAMDNETCAKLLSTYQYTTAVTPQHPEGILLTSTMFSRMAGDEIEGVTITSGKTGYTSEAKHCLVSSAQKNGSHYIALTAGAEGKWNVIFDDFELYENYTPSNMVTAQHE